MELTEKERAHTNGTEYRTVAIQTPGPGHRRVNLSITNRPIKLPPALFDLFKSKSKKNTPYKSIKVLAKWKTRVFSEKLGWLGTSIRESELRVWNEDLISTDFEMIDEDPTMHAFNHVGLEFYADDDVGQRNRASSKTNKGYAEIKLNLCKNNSQKRLILQGSMKTPKRTWSRQRTLGDDGEMELSFSNGTAQTKAMIVWKQKGEKKDFQGNWEDKHKIMFRYYFKKLTVTKGNKYPSYEEVMK